MKRVRSNLRLWGASRKQFSLSVLVAFLGYALVFVIFPPRAFETDGNNTFVAFLNAANKAGQLVIALISLLCGINAYRDESNAPEERNMICLWCVAVTFWGFLSLLALLDWLGKIKPSF
jgi:hypothetical protein